MKLYLASGNAHKVQELQTLADATQLSVEVVSAHAVGGMPTVIEDTGTFAGNALKKARALHALLPPGSWALADDSGLCVDALEGGPGVESAYYAGPEGDSAANLRKLIEVMRSVPTGRRGAHFLCVLVLLAADGTPHHFTGKVGGTLLTEPRGGEGFGYDPLFVPDGHDATFAEMAASDKNRLSHRARAWRQMTVWFSRRPAE